MASFLSSDLSVFDMASKLNDYCRKSPTNDIFQVDNVAVAAGFLKDEAEELVQDLTDYRLGKETSFEGSDQQGNKFDKNKLELNVLDEFGDVLYTGGRTVTLHGDSMQRIYENAMERTEQAAEDHISETFLKEAEELNKSLAIVRDKEFQKFSDEQKVEVFKELEDVIIIGDQFVKQKKHTNFPTTGKVFKNTLRKIFWRAQFLENAFKESDKTAFEKEDWWESWAKAKKVAKLKKNKYKSNGYPHTAFNQMLAESSVKA